MGKVTRSAAISRRRRPLIMPKPYGFCCQPERQPSEDESSEPSYRRRSPPPASALSLGSVHECPALMLRLQVTSKRPQIAWTEGPDGKRVPVEVGASDPGGLLADTTQSSIDLMLEQMRKQRQAEYEKQMDLWADLGVKRTRDRIRRMKCEGRPYWYAEYSFEQLRMLKQLEDSLFKDKKQKSINRTKHVLEALGVLNELKRIDPKVLAKLIRDHSTEPIKFLCEIYKATTGFYPGQEHYDCMFDPSMRIIMSGIAFLELPDIAIELHKLLPPVIKYTLPPKPERPEVKIPKKARAPLLQKLVLPFNNRLYKQKALEWERQCRDLRRPLVVLPKKNLLEQLHLQVEDSRAKLIESKATINAGKKPEPLIKEEEKRPSKESGTSKISRLSGYGEEDPEVTVDFEEFETEAESVSKDELEEIYQEEDLSKETESKNPMHQIEWTSPPSPCPYKYRKLMSEQGPLKENEAFFAALRPAERLREFPEGRENLTMGMQTYLLDVEADMHPLQAKASQLLEEVGRLAREILESGPKCDGCCSCRETRRSHLIWHATQGPHNVIEGVSTDQSGKNQKQVIGSTALHTPASSLSSNSEPPVVPSTEKLVKERVLGGFTLGEDGQPVRHVEAISRTAEHVPERELKPDTDAEVIRNVPPCGCNERRKQLGEEPQEPVDLNALSRGKDEGLCYGVKFRPREGPGYQCGANNPAEEVEPCICASPGRRRQSIEDDCVCDDFLPLGGAESYEGEESPREFSVEEMTERPSTGRKSSFKICVPCGKKAYPCHDLSSSDRKAAETCSCDSLSEFLQLDLCKVKCEMPPKESYAKAHRGSKGSKSPTSKKDESTSDRRKSSTRKSINKEKEEEENGHDDRRRSSTRRASKKNGETADDSDVNGNQRKSVAESTQNGNGNSEKSDEPGKPEKSEKSEKPGKPDKSEKLGKPEKPGKPDKKTAESKKTEKPAKPSKPPKPDKDETKPAEIDELPPKCPEDTGPPYGDRTKSEEALPTELTVAYLVDRHPPDFPTDQIPVREGGRPCRCRENRNNRKKLIFGIGNTTAGDPAAAVIEGVSWLTPVPSVRRSEEYIPEYDVYDSPYGCKGCGAGRPARKSPSATEKIRKQRTGRSDCVLKKDVVEEDEGEEGEEEIAATESSTSTELEVILDRSKDWNNAMKDDYLTDFYAEKPSKVPCWKRCARDTGPRRLKVMKPVCECRYERKIVKREEERRKWRDRKKRLQSLPKEEFLHLQDTALHPIERAEGEEEPLPRCSCVPPAPTEESIRVIEGIALQTPCATPTRKRSCESPNLPFNPEPCTSTSREQAKPAEKEKPAKKEGQPKRKKGNAPKGKKRKSSSSKLTSTEDKAGSEYPQKSLEEKVDRGKVEKIAPEKKLEKVVSEKRPETVASVRSRTEIPPSETVSQVVITVPRRRRRSSYLNRMETELMKAVKNSLGKIKNKKFVSLRFPDYTLMPQIGYWVSYRVKGKNFTRKYRESLLIRSMKIWETKKRKSSQIVAPPLRISKKKKETIHFGNIRYWKKRIAKLKLAFYMDVRKHIVDVGRDEWFFMEFGKFPNVLFKQAYFTYLPTKERDTVAFRPWVNK